MGKLKKKFRSIKKFPTWVFWFPAMFLWVLCRTIYRVRILDPHRHMADSRGAVVVTWHNRLLFFPALFPRKVCKRTVAVVSASRDGQYIVDLIHWFGLRSLRGSSSRRGMNVQLEAVRAIRDGFHVTFTPDGPRGPCYQMQPGPIHLASITGNTGIIPIGVRASRYWSLRSWDRFQIPKPFCQITLELGEWIPIPANLDAAGLEHYRQLTQQKLNEINQAETQQ